MLKNIVDGFTLNAALLYLPNRFFPNALAQLDVLRRAANYRARWHISPDDFNQPIAAYDTLQHQIHVNTGSYLWGWTFAIYTPVANQRPVEVTAIGNILVQITDSCSGIPFFSDFKTASDMRPNGNSQLWPVVLSQPRLILEPGLINIEIANAAATPAYCQLLLHFAEPCEQVEEDLRNPCVS